MKEKCLQVALAATRYEDSWWLPFVLLAVCTLNSITGGMLTWSVGILQKLEFRVTADSPLGGGRARQRWTEAVQLD
eukprot:g19217.t1